MNIKEQDRLKAIGLYTLAREAAKTMEKYTEALASIVDVEGNDPYDRGGWILQDKMWEEDLSGFLEMFDENYNKKP